MFGNTNKKAWLKGAAKLPTEADKELIPQHGVC